MKNEKKEDSDVATNMNYDVASFFSWSNYICNLETNITRITAPPKETKASF